MKILLHLCKPVSFHCASQKEFMPYWNLSVTVLQGKFSRSYDLLSKCDCYVVLKLPTACACCHRTKTVKNSDAPKWNETFRFRVYSGVKNILEFHIFDADKLTKDDYCSTILFDISNLTPGQKQTKCFITDDEVYSFDDQTIILFYLYKVFEVEGFCVQYFKSVSDEKLDVRLDFDIPMEENNFLVKRQKVVSQALQKALNLSSIDVTSQVPLVAVVCSGGGTRAMCGTFGGLRALQKLQLLDTVSYITGISGSTWTMASLYGDANWSNNDLNGVMESVKKEISKSVFSIFSPEQLRHYKEKMEEREKEGHLVSLVDMWGLAIEYLIQGKKKMGTLSDQQMALSKGQNPLPIYTALNMKNEWCEFTPFEVGFTKYGVFIPAQNFGSEYYLGHMVKKLPESGIYSLLGIWSSVFSLSLTQLWSVVTGVIPSWANDKPSTSDTLQVSPMSDLAKKLSNFLTCRPIISQVFNFLRGFHLHRNYSENCDFTTWKDTHPDAFPNSLTPADATLGLVDTAFVIKSGFPPVLRCNRRADVILSLNYAWDPDHFKQTQEYCAERKILFPKIDYKKLESEPIREVYVFEDKENPDVPIVIHFPLVNVSFKQFKSPGVKRGGKAELEEGDFDIDFTSMFCPFATHNLTYQPEDFQKLTNLTTYNILNNTDVILNALNKALKRNMERIPVTKVSKF
uniref:Phospholipase A2 n=1 Tax=Sinocyclocheilus rhinocerous TaxID=307959 RepID=A0A673ID89_9TELE